MNKIFCGIDLHSNNLMVGLADSAGTRLLHRKVDCKLQQLEDVLKPYRKRLEMIAVESTFNWYWLVDGLQSKGYPVVLANPAAMQQYSGIKNADDKNDAYFLAEMLRLNILPTGHIYDRNLRPVRDLMRRRMLLIQQRTALLLSFKSLHTRVTGEEMQVNKVKAMGPKDAAALYEHPANRLISKVQKEHIEALTRSIETIEKAVLAESGNLPLYKRLITIPGIWKILGMTITMEVGEIKRFADAGNFASYCRTVDSSRTSNEKKKGENNAKCGNKYLAWAFVEAANFARRYDEQCRKWFDHKKARSCQVVAVKALACKLAKAAWHVMAEDTDFDSSRIFPELALSKKMKK